MADRREVAVLLASHHPAFSYALQGPDGITAVVPRCFADQTILRSRYDLVTSLSLFPLSSSSSSSFCPARKAIEHDDEDEHDKEAAGRDVIFLLVHGLMPMMSRAAMVEQGMERVVESEAAGA
jgi:hypothetical protein